MQFDRILSKFSGELPLFPLPKVVLFPGARLPLHIFEPRYRQMVSDAEEQEGLIGMVCLRERRSKADTGNSPVHSVACLSQIRNLLYDEGYTIKGVQKLHKDQGLRRLLAESGADLGGEAPDEALADSEIRDRLALVLEDLEAAKARLDRLLGDGGRQA